MMNLIKISDNYGATLVSECAFPLIDVISCLVTEELNGEYELEMEYPINGSGAGKIALLKTILAKPNTTDSPQMFDVYSIDTEGSILKVKARHVYYRLSGCPARYNPNNVTNVSSYIQSIVDYYGRELNGFTLAGSGTNPSAKNSHVDDKGFKSIKERINDAIVDFGAELKVDNMNVSLLAGGRGTVQNSKLSIIKYGYNIANIAYSHDTDGASNAVFPYYSGNDSFMYPPTISKHAGVIDYTLAEIRDITNDYKDGITQAQLNALQVSLSNKTSLNGTTSIDVEMIDLVRAQEAEPTGHYRISLGDTWRVKHDPIGIDANMKISKLVYNPLIDAYENISLGKIDTGLAGTIAGGSSSTIVSGGSGGGLQLGETDSTAYRGDRGKVAYDHSQTTAVHVTNAQKTAWNSHIVDSEIHVTQKEKDKWNAGGGGVEHINVDGTMSVADIVDLDIGIYYVENPIYIEYYDDHGNADSRDMAGTLSIFYDNEHGDIMYSWVDYDLIVYGYEGSAEAFEYSIDNAAGGSSPGGAVLIRKQALRPSGTTELTLASKTWTNVHSSTPATLSLAKGIYMIEFNSQVVGAATGYVMFRPVDGSTEINNHRSSAPVISSTYSACNTTFILNVTTAKNYTISFQAYASAASHRVGVTNMQIWKIG